MKGCAFDGCNKLAATAGYCVGHYRQHHVGEQLRPLQLQYHGLSEYERFFMRVEKKNPNECWNWSGSRTNSKWHGQWRNSAGNIELAHRAAWRLMRCDIPREMFVLHRCDNPICVNPSHLFLGTQSENLKDMWAKGRGRPMPSHGEKHGMSKLTAKSVLEIRESNLSAKEIASKFGVGTTTIYDIRKRKIWKHI